MVYQEKLKVLNLRLKLYFVENISPTQKREGMGIAVQS